MILQNPVYLFQSVQEPVVVPRRKREYVLSVASEFVWWKRSCADVEFAKRFPLLQREDHDGNILTRVGFSTSGILDPYQRALCNNAVTFGARRETIPVLLHNGKPSPIIG